MYVGIAVMFSLWPDVDMPEAFHLDLEKTFLKAFTIERIKSFLAKRRLPQFGQEANKDTYSVSLVLFQLCEHDKHFIFHPLFEPEAFHSILFIALSPQNIISLVSIVIK